MASTNKNYLANTQNANSTTLNALYDVASQAGIKNYQNMSSADLTTAIKQATGTSGNTYGNTIGNKTLNQYGYSVDKNGNIYKTNSGIQWSNEANPNATVSNTITTIPGTNYQVANNNSDGWYAYDQGAAAYQNYLNNMNTLQNGYDQYVTTLQGGAGNANAALDEARQNALAGIKSTYDDSARNYYRLYRTQEKELPEQLSSIGATGGASESAALRLMNAYSDNLNKNETARNKDTNALNEDYYNAVAQNSQKLAGELANAYLQLAYQQQGLQDTLYTNQSNIYNNYLNTLKENEAAELAAQEKAAATQAQAALTSRNNTVRANEAARQREGYTTVHWTDADGAYHYQISGTQKKNSVGGSSGSNSNNNNTPETSAMYDYVYNMANSHANDRDADGRTSGSVAALNYIYNSNLITDSEKKQMAKDLGLL